MPEIQSMSAAQRFRDHSTAKNKRAQEKESLNSAENWPQRNVAKLTVQTVARSANPVPDFISMPEQKLHDQDGILSSQPRQKK